MQISFLHTTEINTLSWSWTSVWSILSWSLWHFYIIGLFKAHFIMVNSANINKKWIHAHSLGQQEDESQADGEQDWVWCGGLNCCIHKCFCQCLIIQCDVKPASCWGIGLVKSRLAKGNDGNAEVVKKRKCYLWSGIFFSLFFAYYANIMVTNMAHIEVVTINRFFNEDSTTSCVSLCKMWSRITTSKATVKDCFITEKVCKEVIWLINPQDRHHTSSVKVHLTN